MSLFAKLCDCCWKTDEIIWLERMTEKNVAGCYEVLQYGLFICAGKLRYMVEEAWGSGVASLKWTWPLMRNWNQRVLQTSFESI